MMLIIFVCKVERGEMDVSCLEICSLTICLWNEMIHIYLAEKLVHFTSQ